MKNTANFLDALRAKLNLSSDGQLADYLGMHRQHVSRYRTLGGTFDDEMSIKVANILGLESTYVMACMHHQRAKQPQVKAAWKHAAELLYGLAAALALVAILPTIPTAGEHQFNIALLGLAGFDLTGALYIMSNLAASYWWLLIPLAALAWYYFPRHNPRQKT